MIYKISLIIASMCLFGWADRLSGGGVGWKPNALPGRPLWYATLVIVLFACAVSAWWAPAAFFIWRTPSWRILGSVGGMTPTTGYEGVLLALRHSLIFIAVPLNYFSPNPQPVLLTALLALWVVTSTHMALYMGSLKKPSDINWLVEICRGVGLGFCFGLVII